MDVAIRELKAHLSRLLALAQQGEIINVTSYRKPIARIVGLPPEADQKLQGLIAAGGLSWNGQKPELQTPVTLSEGGTAVSDMVLENRG